MTTSDYLIDSALVLVVLLQLKERRLTARVLLRPLVIVAVAVAIYARAIPTAGNDPASARRPRVARRGDRHRERRR